MTENQDKWKQIHQLQPMGETPLTMDKQEFMRLLNSAEIDTEIAEEVVSRLEETGIENNIIFIFTEEDYVVTAIHVPADSIDGEDGPVLMRGARDKSIIAAFSRELIIRKLDIIDDLPPGLPLIADQAWVDELEKMAEAVKIQMSSNPPERWEDLLEGDR
jgi:hypothetical protein